MGFLDWVKELFQTKKQTKITTKDLNKIYRADEPLQMILTDKYNKPLADSKVVFNINGVDYERKTDGNGLASLNINLNTGNYTGLCKYEGNDVYAGATAYSTVTVSPKLTTSNLTMNYKDGSKFKAKATDAKGAPIQGCQIVFTVNGVAYPRNSDVNGEASLNINLNTGVYSITTSSLNSNCVNTITVNPPIPDDAISYNEYLYLMNRVAWWLINNNKSFKKRDVYNYFKDVAKQADLIATIKFRKGEKNDDPLVAEFVECAIVDNSKSLTFLPNYVEGTNGKKYYKSCYVDMANRVSAYETTNNASPRYVTVRESAPVSDKNTEILEYFQDKFGVKLTDFDSFLSAIQGRGYSGYYNSQYPTKKTIDRMKNKQGVNCTDSSQVGYVIALALGYEVQFVHVKCSSGTGHVRLRLKHPVNTEGTWIYRDPASVLNGNSIRSNWCTSNYTLLAYDPAWVMTDIYS